MRRFSIFLFFLFSVSLTNCYTTPPISRLFDKQYGTIHTIGDSHSKFSFEPIGGCTIQWLGPRTMHRVGREGLSGINLLKHGIRENDTVIFVFGEIDVRCHIGKIRDQQGIDENVVLELLAQNYISTIVQNRKLFKKIHCIVFAVLPPTHSSNPSYPTYGSLEDRISITKKLNIKLHAVAARHGIYVLDVFDDYATPEGSLIPEYSDGGVHIGAHYTDPVKRKLFELFQKIHSKKK